MKKEHGFATKAIHAGQRPDPTTGAIMTPVYFTSTYVQEGPGVHKGFDYARTVHPTRLALEANLAALEGAEHGLCFASGMAATSTVIEALDAGDHVVSCNDLYGGTYRVFTKVFQRFGLSFTFIDATDLWGKGTYETQAILGKKKDHAVIGPAGENLVRFAGIVSGERIAGRTGTGSPAISML